MKCRYLGCMRSVDKTSISGFYCNEHDKLNWYRCKESSQMTREEAVKKVEAYYLLYPNPSAFVQLLETLGLLKFEPVYDPSFKEAGDKIAGKYPKIIYCHRCDKTITKQCEECIISDNVKDVAYNANLRALDIINALLKYNYKIVDCDLYNVVDKRKKPVDFEKIKVELEMVIDQLNKM